MNLNIRLLDPIYTQIVYAQNWNKTSRSISNLILVRPLVSVP
jgi:hypothetical protein